MIETFLDGKVTLLRGDCLELLPTLAEGSIDSCVTDPPYHLTSIVKRFGTAGAYKRASRGFMGKQWDGGDIAFRPEVWAEVLRALKPGGHLIAFGGTRTYHRMTCAIEDAGFEIRDCIMWVYGSGFPKSHDVSKGIDRAAGAKRTVKTGTKPGHEGFVGRKDHPLNSGWDRPWASDPEAVDRYHSTYAPATSEAEQWQGWGTALKPAVEPIVLARKPLSEKSIAANVLKWGTGAINVDGCRIGTEQITTLNTPGKNKFEHKYSGDMVSDRGSSTHIGRWPANLIHDGSEEVLERLSGKNYARSPKQDHFGDEGSAARFFYIAKADADDRLGSKHPTVKPTDLIQYLVRLITPPGGCVLDPFAGTGTCGEAAFREGATAILVEREAEYQADIVKRMGLCLSCPDERRAASVKQLPPGDLPMFGGAI